MQRGSIYSVTMQPISLAYGDYVVRQWMAGKRSYQSLHSAKAAVARLLHAQLQVRWYDGLVGLDSVTGVAVDDGISRGGSNGAGVGRINVHDDLTGTTVSVASTEQGRCAALQLASLMRGRKLLYGELQSLVADQVQGGASYNWRAALQRCIIEGSIVVGSSVQLQRLGSGSQQARYCCLRCYEQQLEHTSSVCTYCGEACYYCKECLVMGRSRTCGLLLIGRYFSPLLGEGPGGEIETIEDIEGIVIHPSQIVQLGRYHLSPAQQKATKAALGYIYRQNKRYVELRARGRVEERSMGPEDRGRNRQLADDREKKVLRKRSAREGVALARKLLDHMIGYRLQQLQNWRQRYDRNYLIWAVTGAGKTEMIFPLIEYVTKQGGKVLLATPRRDVVLELDPRLRKAFPELSIVTLYGGSTQRWQEGQLVVATTHQLMRFQRTFELVIIDELDAFPYHGDPRLYRVAAQCSTLGGIRILLSATPPRVLQQAMSAKLLSYVLLPVRYHRHPLPVPTMLTTPSIAEQLRKSSIPAAVITAMKQSIARGAQLFVFVQRIAEAEPYVTLLQRYFPSIVIAATSSKDDGRTEKVQAFRQRHIRMLVTTTILERGVTIPQSDVYICDADGALFDEASLVQMAGRAGRSADDPKGKVYFAAKHRNEAQLRALKQIVRMNKQARKERYLLEQYW